MIAEERTSRFERLFHLHDKRTAIGFEGCPATWRSVSLAGRGFTRFHLDVGVGDAVVPPTELIQGCDWLGFTEIAPPKLMAISKEQQFAEKLTPTHCHVLIPQIGG